MPTLKPAGQGPEEQFFSNAVIQDSNNFAAAVANNQSFTGQFFAVPLATSTAIPRLRRRKPGPQHLPKCRVQRF
jgi:hypothetical protein